MPGASVMAFRPIGGCPKGGHKKGAPRGQWRHNEWGRAGGLVRQLQSVIALDAVLTGTSRVNAGRPAALRG